MSVSTWCLNSVSAISMPAMKAPSASESPASSVSQARPSVTSSRLRTNSSSLLRRTTSVSQRRITHLPPTSSTASRAPALTNAIARASSSTSGDEPSAGISTSKGTTARSWNSSTPMTRRPCSLSSSSRSAMSLTTIAVELIARALPRAIAPCQSSPRPRLPASASSPGQERVAGERGKDRQHHLAQAEAEDQPLHALQLRQVELEADHEHQEDDAELGQVRDAGRVAARDRHRVRADQGADREIAEDRRQAREAAENDAGNRRHEIEQSQFERRSHAWRAM